MLCSILEEEIRLHLTYLYPLAETVISDPTIWVLGYLATYYPEYIEKELTEAKRPSNRCCSKMFNRRYERHLHK